MEFMTCVSFGHSCFHVVSTCRYDCSCVSLYVYTYMIHCIIAMSLLYYCCIIIVVLPQHIQTCLNSFEFPCVYYAFKYFTCCLYTVINPVLLLFFIQRLYNLFNQSYK